MSLAAVNIPQLLGYTRIAGTPVVAGLYTALLPAIAFAGLASSRHLVVAADSATAAIFASALAPLAPRASALRYREDDDTNADLLGLSAANAAAAVSGAFVVNGSPTQTAVAERAGAASQWAQLTLAAVIVLVLLFATGPLQYLPHAVLAAIVFTIGLGLIDQRDLREVRRESPGEFTLALVTAATVAMVGVEQGALLAVALSLLRHVRHSYLPHTAVLVRVAAGRNQPQPATPGVQSEPGLIVYRFGADLFYANDQRFTGELRALVDGAPAPVRCVVVDASAVADLDYSAARALRELLDDLRARGVRPLFGRVGPALRSDMQRHGIVAALGADAIFLTLHEAIAAARKR